MKTTFREICNNDPAVAIAALIDSLTHQDRVPWLRLDFDTYHTYSQGHCYGCGATFALLSLAKSGASIPELDPIVFTSKSLLVKYLNSTLDDTWEFENAIDDLRCGSVFLLSKYFAQDLPNPDPKWRLDNAKGLRDLPLIQDYYDRLTAP